LSALVTNATFYQSSTELNPIEMYWGWAKYRYRSLGDGSFAIAKTLVPEILDTCETTTIRKFFRKSWRYMDAYR